jgi:hypothetical protein
LCIVIFKFLGVAGLCVPGDREDWKVRCKWIWWLTHFWGNNTKFIAYESVKSWIFVNYLKFCEFYIINVINNLFQFTK